MVELKKVLIPDIGDFKDVPVIEILVKVSDRVNQEDSLVTLESEKATIEIPSPYSGIIKEIYIKAGDKVSEGSAILTIEAEQNVTNEAVRQSEKLESMTEKPLVMQSQIVIPKDRSAPSAKLAGMAQATELSSAQLNLPKAHASPSIRRLAIYTSLRDR